MKRTRVNSTSIASIGYRETKCELEIEFRENGRVYRYFDVPKAEHAAFMDAESKGTYLNEIFKTRGYHYIVVNETSAPA